MSITFDEKLNLANASHNQVDWRFAVLVGDEVIPFNETPSEDFYADGEAFYEFFKLNKASYKDVVYPFYFNKTTQKPEIHYF